MRFFFPQNLSIPPPCPHPSCFAHTASMQKKILWYKNVLLCCRREGVREKIEQPGLQKKGRGEASISPWPSFPQGLCWKEKGPSSKPRSPRPQCGQKPVTTMATSPPPTVSGSDSTEGFCWDRFPAVCALGGSNNA